MDEYIRFSIIIALVIAIQIFTKVLRSKKIKDQSDILLDFIKQPKYYLYVGIGGLIIFTSGGIYAYIDNAWPYSIICGLIDLFYIWIILLQTNWKIEIRETEFTYRNIFGKRKIYKYEDVVVKKLSRSTRFYYNDKHIVSVSYLLDNWDALEKSIQNFKKDQKRRIEKKQ